jgi:peptidoglycan/LPS O-acetylase OafA/YrhL
MVMSFHFCYNNAAANYPILIPFTWFGWVGVEVFFVISGVVIANSADGATAKSFLKGRMLRLYPSAWICATVTLIVIVLSGGTNLATSYLHSMALLPKGPWISPVYWTLAVEICFYSLVFLLLVFNRFADIGWLAMALTGFSAVYIFAATLGVLRELESLNVVLVRHGCMFALGIWIWLSTVRRLSVAEYTGVAVAILATAAEIRLTGHKFLPREVLGEGYVFTPIAVWFVVVAAIAYFMTGTASRRLPRLAGFRTLGLMTYPLYLVHDISGRALILLLLSLGVGKWAALAAGFSPILLLSFAILRLEVRVRRGLNVALNWVDGKFTTKWVAETS